MFKAPPEIGTEVFTRIPDQYRKSGQLSPERILAGKGSLKTDSYIEGPTFDRDGNLYIVDIAFGLIYQINPQGQVKLVVEYDGEPNGLKIHHDGRIFVADHKNGVMLLDPESGSIKPYIGRYKTESFKGLNDLVFSKAGALYFTDQGQSGLQDPSGRVFCLDTSGNLNCLLNNVPSPNGIALNLEENFLYIAVTRANSVWRAMLLADGSITRVGNFIQLSGGSGPDGLAVDQAGNLYVAHAGLGSVWKFSAQGEPLLRIRSCAGMMTTNLAFGGKDNQDLFITESESGSILRARMDTPGLTLFSHQ
jgi:gluconolactonase